MQPTINLNNINNNSNTTTPLHPCYYHRLNVRIASYCFNPCKEITNKIKYNNINDNETINNNTTTITTTIQNQGKQEQQLQPVHKITARVPSTPSSVNNSNNANRRVPLASHPRT
eukprot:TRINITY_DN4212_c0_g2_i4.p1 TRINITY_DN4212_c0_g2~~TRINITY_DN4212_c0_g2_i4.p1  ORF type:complete len:115 (-),score=40.00 TRINITY_DN4212_c0_g2_i4:287-631(-)